MSASILMLLARIALAVCLYGFLTLILIVLWRDLRAAQSSGSGSGARPSLQRIREDGSQEKAFPLTRDSCLIGRSPSVEIPLADETVSAVHARVWKKGDSWWLEDLDSRNGTFLNQIPVTKGAVLCSGDRIRVGRILLAFHIENPPVPVPASEPPATPESSS
jgi:pSer/pThr/pTyr-binding forkhead associated (FHA) protein